MANANSTARKSQPSTRNIVIVEMPPGLLTELLDCGEGVYDDPNEIALNEAITHVSIPRKLLPNLKQRFQTYIASACDCDAVGEEALEMLRLVMKIYENSKSFTVEGGAR